MRLLWLKLLLLATFAYWASGAAKFVHEMTEHHGGRTSGVIDDDDDDDDVVPKVAVATGPSHRSEQGPAHHGHPCPVCQMLAAMVIDRSAPPVVLTPSREPVATLAVIDRDAPVVRSAFTRLTTGPPSV